LSESEETIIDAYLSFKQNKSIDERIKFLLDELGARDDADIELTLTRHPTDDPGVQLKKTEKII
jgi:hypothetical protein